VSRVEKLLAALLVSFYAIDFFVREGGRSNARRR
jgi:hypothetical protein